MAVFGFELPVLLVLVGLVLMILEAMSPGAHFIVIGVALLLAGMLGITVDPLASPIALAGLTLLFGALALFVYREYDIYGGTTSRTSDSDSLRGATGRVVDRVSETDGRVKLTSGGFNPFYQARTVDGEIAAGEEVIVVDPGGGNVVTVTALESAEGDEIERELARDTAPAGKGGEDPGGDGGAGPGVDGGGNPSADGGGAPSEDEDGNPSADGGGNPSADGGEEPDGGGNGGEGSDDTPTEPLGDRESHTGA